MLFKSLALALVALASSASAAAPSGTYTGSKTVLGQTVNAIVNVVDGATLDLTLSGAFALECVSEKYHMEGANVALDDLGNADDCIAKTLAEEKVDLKTIVFDEGADSVTVSVKYSVMSIDLVLTKAGMDFDFMPVLTTSPTGTYSGSKTVLGETINAQINMESDSSLEFIISGIIDIDCTGEEFTISGDEMQLTHVTEAGDCAHDALESNKVTLKDIKYDQANDQITVSVKYSVMSIDLTLSKTGAIGWKITSLPKPAALLGAPAGTYYGTVTKLGQTVNGQVVVVDDATINLVISGAIDISCEGEAFHLSGSDVVVDHITEAGDCAHDALDENNVTLKSITYDEANDQITVSVKYSLVSVDIVLSQAASIMKAGFMKNLRGSATY